MNPPSEPPASTRRAPVKLLTSPLPLQVPCRACEVCAGRIVGDAECVNTDPARHHEAAQVAIANVEHLAQAWHDDATQRAAAATDPAEQIAWHTLAQHCGNILAAFATPGTAAAAECPHCPDGHARPLSRSWGVYVAATRDGDGQPTTIHVARSDGSHVAESDAAWIRQLIDGDQTSASQIVGELLGPLNAQIAVAEYEQGEARQQANDALAALAQVRLVRRRINAVLIALADRLDRPYPDDPGQTPWTRFVKPAMHALTAAVDAAGLPPESDAEAAVGRVLDWAETLRSQSPKGLGGHLHATVLDLVYPGGNAAAETKRRGDAEAQALADETGLRSLTVKGGALNISLAPPRELAALWVRCARGMLGDAPNYTETRVDVPTASMEVGQAGSAERYLLTVQRVGNVTPHEARQRAEATVARVRAALAKPVMCGPNAVPSVPVAAIERALDVPADSEQPATTATTEEAPRG
ncbi:hypothetical protein [Sphaerisporangium aureirubrum]|uniref:Uncharacterized protein n=1 Tax=Sphaerisporangium aureirubrum TaxID=1544736 RepID=A0ABW1NG02_9ACTN